MTPHEHALSLDQFHTPPALAKAVVEWAHIQPGQKVLEPSCGEGDLVRWMPEDVQITAIDIDPGVWGGRGRRQFGWGPLMNHPGLTPCTGDFLQHRAPSDAFDIAIMNPPYGYVGRGKQRQAADRLHVQHALRMAPDVICLVRANFLWGQERYRHIFKFARVVRMAVLVHRPAFRGPAVLPSQTGGQHEIAVFHLRRLSPEAGMVELPIDSSSIEFWTQDWAVDP